MPLELIPQQPFFTDPDRPAGWSCTDDPEYCHKVAPGDTVNVQFYQTPCNDNEIDDPTFSDTTQGAQILLEPDFTTVVNWVFIGTSWTHAAGKVTHVVGNTDSMAQAVALVAGWYKVQLTVVDMTAGNVYVRISGTAGGTSPFFVENGSYTFYLYFTAGAQLSIIPSSDFDGAIDQCDLYSYAWNDWSLVPPIIPDVAGGTMCKLDNTAIATLTNTQGGSVWITSGNYYEVQITITNYSSGSITVDCSDITSSAFSGNGTFTFWATPTINGTLVVNMSSDFVGCISSPIVYLLRNDYSINLNGLSGDIALPSSYISYFERWVTVMFDPDDAGLPFPECFTIEVTDQCDVQYGEFAINGDFIGGSGSSCPDWANNNANTQYDYTLEQLKLSFNGTLFGNSATPFANNTPNPNYIDTVGQITNYKITFDVLSKNALPGDGINDKAVGDPNDIQASVNIYGQTTPNSWFGVGFNQTYNVALPAGYGQVVDNPNTLRLQAFARFNGTGVGLPSRGDITIDNIRVEKLAPYTASFETECIKYDEHPNTLLVVGWGTESDSLGFNWSSGFLLMQRIGARSVATQFELGESRYTFSDGDTSKYYSDRAKFWELFVDLAPHSVHDALSVQIQCTNVAMGPLFTELIAYIVDAEYVPQFDRTGASDMAQGRLRLKRKNENTVFKRNC